MAYKINILCYSTVRMKGDTVSYGRCKIYSVTKEIREEINHKIHEARAYEIAKFHKGYVFGKTIL